MPDLVWVLLAIPLMGSCATETERSNAPQLESQGLCADSSIEDRGTNNAKEILGSRFGEFIFIPGGTFTMGCNKGENVDERPEHIVDLSSFYVGRTPVANAQFVRFLNDARVTSDEYLVPQAHFLNPSITLAGKKWLCSKGTENDAVSCGSWVLANKYCDWLSAQTGRKCRLPTEAEWEYTCRGKEGRKFPWGDSQTRMDSKIWGWRTWKSEKPNLIPVGSYPEGATPEGVCDLIGYMDEVCSDWSDPKYYAKSPRKNPQGPSKPFKLQDAKVVRGGVERPYTSGSSITRFFRDSQFFGVLPTTYLPRGWSRGATVPPKEPRFVYGRLGFRVVVEVRKEEEKDVGHARLPGTCTQTRDGLSD